MKIHCKKILSLLLAICMLLTLSPVTPVAAEETATNETTLSTTEEIIETDAMAAAPAMDLTADCAILNYVDEEVFAAGNHVLRLAEEETLSSYVFLNADGTKTVYYLDEAVKFVDSDGTIQEKDVTLALSGTAYTTTRNDISLSIPTNPANGITLIWNGHAVRIIPQGGTLSDIVLDGNSIRYTDYYGEGMDLVYTPTLTGVKEDIVLESYTGQNVFTFMLNTGGLNLYSTNGRYYLAESKTATDRIELGDLVTFDANGRFSVGTMTSQTISAGNIYRLTLTVDEDFLTDPDTVYPVSIDPELSISDNTHGSGAIEDVGIYSGTPNATANWKYMHVGYYDDTYEVGRILVRLTGLLNDTEYQNMSASQISSATFYLTEATGKAAANINLYAFKGNSNWTESGATWNNVGVTNLGDLIDTVSHGRSVEASYDITDLLKGWKEGESAATAGLILCHSSEDTKTKGFYSSEYTSNTDYRPYVKVIYDSTSGMIEADQNYVPEGESIVLTATGMNGQITWTSSNPARATVSSTGVVTGILAGQVTITASCEGYTDKNCVIWVTVPDGYYYLENAASNLILECTTTSANNANCFIDSLDEASSGHAAEVWKIKYVIGGRYIIRPLSRMVSCLTSNSAKNALVIDYHIADTFSAVPASASWTIGHNSFGYYFYNNSNEQATLRPAASNTAGVNAVVGSWTSTLDAHWELLEAKAVVLRDVATNRSITINTTMTLELGDTRSYQHYGMALLFVGTMSSEEWCSSNTSVASVDSNGYVTALSVGSTTVSVSASSGGGVYTSEYVISVCDSSESDHSHLYSIQPGGATVHPHITSYLCECGDGFVRYGLRSICPQCTENSLVVSGSASGVLLVTFIAEENGFFAPIITSVECTVTYQNLYKIYGANTYEHPQFASFSSNISSSYSMTDGYPDIVSDAVMQVDYYSDDDTLLSSQPMQIAGNDTGCACPANLLNAYLLSTVPAYTKAYVKFASAGDYPHYICVEVTTEFLS